jgi:PAS domain S-box-containing protein
MSLLTRLTRRLPRFRHGDGSPEAAAYLAAIVESSDDAIISKDLAGVIRSWNAGAERMFGYSAAEAVGQPITLIVPPGREPEEQEILARLRRGERVEHFETVRVGRDGRELAISLSVSPIRDASGKVVGASKIARNITERKRAEDALAEQREWLQTTLESIGDAVIATDPRGEIVFMNAVAEHLTGWRREDARGKACTEVFHIVNEVTRQPADNPVQRVLKEGVVIGLANHTLLIAADGTERPIDDSAAPIRHRDARIAGTVLVFRDVTDRRQVENERYAAMLERERLLENERAARADAERANRLKDEFVAIVSHELRTPLNAMMGWTEILANDQSEAETRARAVEVLRRNTRLQAQLVSDLLDMSRMLSGKLRLDLQSVELPAVIRDAVQTVQSAADNKGLEVTTDLEEGVGIALADPARLQQVLCNLLLNAVKFTPRGGRVSVTLRQIDAAAEITVSDDGVGIRPELLSSIFDRFRQADSSTSRRFGGLGLGLAIVKQLVEMHGGTVRAASDGEGRGASFTVSLAVGTASARPGGLALPEATGDTAGVETSLHDLTVLVVEDDPDSRDLIERWLGAQGAKVASSPGAAQALEMLPAVRPDVLVCDIGLPDMDGYELMQRVRALDPARGGTIPAVAVTAFARPEDRTRALRAGYQAHIAKPVRPADLIAIVRSFGDLAAARRR